MDHHPACLTCPVCEEHLLALVTVDGSHVCLGRPGLPPARILATYCGVCGEDIFQEGGCVCARFDRGMRTATQRQRELDDIYVSSQGLDFFPKGYVEWRLEFERTGIAWAYERMTESYEGVKSDSSWKDEQKRAAAKSAMERESGPEVALWLVPVFLYGTLLGIVLWNLGLLRLF